MSTEVSMDALVRLFGDELGFAFMPGGTQVAVILRGERIATVPVNRQMYPGDSLVLTLGDRTWKFRAPRWTLNLRLDPVDA